MHIELTNEMNFFSGKQKMFVTYNKDICNIHFTSA